MSFQQAVEAVSPTSELFLQFFPPTCVYSHWLDKDSKFPETKMVYGFQHPVEATSMCHPHDEIGHAPRNCLMSAAAG